MKGYSPRERNGMIVLASLVVLCFCIEPLARVAGCTRVEDAPPPSGVGAEGMSIVKTDSSAEDSAVPYGEVRKNIRREERSEAHHRSDSIRDARKKARKDSARAARKHRKSGKSGRQKAAPVRRSLRDERL